MKRAGALGQWLASLPFTLGVRGSFPGLGGLNPLVKLSIVGSLRVREVACLASDLHGLNFEFCVWRAVLSHSSHHPQEVHLAQFSMYVDKSGLKPDLFYFFTWGRNHDPNYYQQVFKPLCWAKQHQTLVRHHGQHNVTLEMKGCICHLVKWQIHPFISKGAITLSFVCMLLMLALLNSNVELMS